MWRTAERRVARDAQDNDHLVAVGGRDEARRGDSRGVPDDAADDVHAVSNVPLEALGAREEEPHARGPLEARSTEYELCEQVGTEAHDVGWDHFHLRISRGGRCVDIETDVREVTFDVGSAIGEGD